MLNADALNQLKQLRSDIKAEKTLLDGTVKRVTGRFGFVALDDGQDVYLPQEEAQRVLIGDRVRLSLVEGGQGRPAGELESLESQNLATFIGQYQVRGKGHFVAPDINGFSRWLFVPPKQRADARDGDYVHCRVSRHPFRSGNAQAEILEVIGHATEPGIERSYAMAKYALREDWPEPVEKEVAALSEESINELASTRTDLSDREFVTIDAPSTQDMDDAVHASTRDDGWLLSVAIADPAALLPEDGATELEARQRASAAYFPGQPRTMLPSQISQNLGSLVPGAQRLALVCEIHVQPDGALGNYRFIPALIRSRAKLSYDAVAKLFEGTPDDDIRALDQGTSASLAQLRDVLEALRGWRERHALVNEDRPDYRLKLNEARKIRTIEKRHQTPAHRLIEECMIAANRCAADFLSSQAGSGLFITHGGIRPEKIESVQQLLQQHCPELAELDPNTPEGFAALVRGASALETELPVKAIVMRQLERAELATKAAPHQGMGLPLYTTMTSPLRKYSDYFVHRLIRHHLGIAPPPEWTPEVLSALQESQWQLRQAVNEMEQSLKCQFAPSLGSEPMKGQIVQVNAGGFQVRLDDTGLVGFVSARDMEGKFSFDPVTHRLSNAEQTFQLEQTVKVRFREVDQERRQIRFDLVPDDEG